MKKKNFLSVIGLITSIMLMGCAGTVKEKSESKQNDKKNIIVSFYPLKQFAEEIADDKVDVTCLVPENIEPHDFEPKAKDLESLNNADAFIYNGLNMENWLDSVQGTITNKDLLLVNSTEGVKEEKVGDAIDPHSWLSLKNAEIQSKNIKDTLVKVDPDNKDYYENNYEKFKGELEDLYKEYKTKFDSLNRKDFITGHAAFGYLCRDFGLTQKSVQDLFAEGEPTPGQLEELVNFCKENNIKTVFSESLASPKVSETLANEVGAEVVPILTLESNEEDKDYIDSMKYNLDVIYNCFEKEK